MKEMVELCLQIYELCGTIREGAFYLLEHVEDERIREDIKAGAAAIRCYIDEIELEKENKIWCELEAEITAPVINSSRLAAVLERFQNWSCEAISKKISEILKDVPNIERDLAEKLFCFLRQAPHTNVAVYQLGFEICTKASLSMPQVSFEYMVQMLEEQPTLLCSKELIHPNYIYHPAEQRTFDVCPICGGHGTPYYRAFAFAIADFSEPHLPVKLWMQCTNCGNLYTWKYPEKLLAGPEKPGYQYPDPSQYTQTIGEVNGLVLSIWSDILNNLRIYTKGGALLDVGVGQGELIAVAQEMGYDVDAVEIVTDIAQRTSNMLNLPVWNGDFLEYKTDKTYSIITMGDVIEHMTDPKRALENAYRLLKEDGVLWLSTPNFESSFSKIRKFGDPMWCEPYHITYFSYGGLRNLVEQCGFQVEEYHVSARYNGSMELILTKR